MKNRTNWLSIVLSIIVVLLLVVMADMVKAQEEPPGEEVPGEGETMPEVESPAISAIVLNDVIQVQGRLTNASGVPINGIVTVVASLYDVASGGTARCTDTDSVTAVNGLFTFGMDFCTADDFNGDQLFIGLKVGSDPEMTPRQEIFAVPYAWGLRPGAIVKGADSFIFIPANSFIRNTQADTTQWDIEANGAVIFRSGALVGTKTIYIPITLPGVLYGQPTTIEQITVYYKCLNAASYIDYMDLNVLVTADTWANVANNDTNLTSTTATSYTLIPTASNVLSANQGILGFYIYLTFANQTDWIEIGGIRLRLGHQ